MSTAANVTGQMMDEPLLISGLIEHAARNFKNQEIVSKSVEGPIHRYCFPDALKRIYQLANALQKLKVKPGDCIATLAWNTYRHFELYFAISGMGAIIHTINPRLFKDQLSYIINHAEDKLIFVDISFVPLVEMIKDQLPTGCQIIVMTDQTHMPKSSSLNLLCYETLLDEEPDEFDWPHLDENTACSLCYTSGTTGNPKGVLYSHRSTILHALFVNASQRVHYNEESIVLPVVPLFHVNGWGTPYTACLSGFRLLFPGPNLDGASLTHLINQEKATALMGVPSVWTGLLHYLEEHQQKIPSVHSVLLGGSAAPKAMIKAFDEKHTIFLVHGWGMTEMSPLGTVNHQGSDYTSLNKEEQYNLQSLQGKPIYGTQLKLVDDQGKELPQDGKAYGRLLVKGPAIVKTYFKEKKDALEEGWFDTGDVASISPDGYMKIVDRNKDVIKSGGEWISSLDIENIASQYKGVSQACVVGLKHPKWEERPLLFIVKNKAFTGTKDDVLNFLKPKLAKWWLPDDVAFIDEIPLNATGKFWKLKLRESYKDYFMKTFQDKLSKNIQSTKQTKSVKRR